MEELTALLNAIDDSYYDFVSAMINYAAKKPTRQKLLVDYIKNTIKIWLSAKTQYLSAFSRKQTHQFTTYLLLTNEPWYASFPRYAKIWYSTSVLKQEKIE